MELPITGLAHIIGDKDTGKTTLALSTGVQPSEIAMFDCDLKGKAVSRALREAGKPLGAYYNLINLFRQGGNQPPIEFYNLVGKCVTEVAKRKDEFKVLIFDGWSVIEPGIRSYSMAVMEEVSDLTRGQIVKMNQLTWPFTYQIYGALLSRLMDIAPLVIITTHTKDEYIGNNKTGRKLARGQRPIAEKANFRVWLRHNPSGSPAPIGLVLKRILKLDVCDEMGIIPTNVLPRKIDPCTWGKIREYIENPMGNRQPTPEETPNEFEISIMDGDLTDDQRQVMKSLRQVANSQEEPGPMDETMKAMAIGMKEQGDSPQVIAETLGVALPTVYSWVA